MGSTLDTCCVMCRALPTLQALVSVFVAVYSQLLILGGTLMFISFLFGLIFSHTTAAAPPDAERLAIQIYLHTCLLNGSLTSERVRREPAILMLTCNIVSGLVDSASPTVQLMM